MTQVGGPQNGGEYEAGEGYYALRNVVLLRDVVALTQVEAQVEDGSGYQSADYYVAEAEKQYAERVSVLFF